MKRPVISSVRHGTPACGQYGCKREECLEAFRAYKRENYRNRKNGIEGRVPCDKALAHVRKLMRKDMPPQDIGTVSGICETIIVKMLNGSQERIHWVTEEALLGVPVPEFGWTPVGDGFTEVVGSTRRVRALSLQGFSAAAISDAAGIPVRNLRAVRSAEHPKILISGAHAIRLAHDRLWDADPLGMGFRSQDVLRARKHAENMGWHPTEAWADIDDPDCEPVVDPPSYMSLAEDGHELMSEHGCTLKEAADRLGVTTSQLGCAFANYTRAKRKAAV